jgi:hypothetical protein
VSATGPVAGTAARRARQEAARRPPPADGGSRDATDRPASPDAGTGHRRRLDPDALAALEEERDFLLRSLRDLERERRAGDVDDHDYAALEDDYTARAAAVLRAIETHQAILAARRRPAEPTRRVVIGVLVALFAVVAGVAMAQASGRRGTGDQITGDVTQTARDKLFAARQAMGEGRFMEAVGMFDEVAGMSPSNAEAPTYKGWLLVLTARRTPAGPDQDLLRARALAELDRAVGVDPRYPDARVFRAAAYGDVGRAAEGLADLAVLQSGDVPVELGPLVDSLRARLQEQVATATPAPS